MLRSTHAVLTRQITDWHIRGLLSQAQSAALTNDVQANHPPRSFTFGAFIIIAGALCVFFAALSFVAANWEDMPRLGKLALLFGSMWAFWIGGILTRLRGYNWISEALLFLGSAFFGLNIMLIAQIYHIQGNAVDAVWIWAVGTTLACVLARSRLTLLGAISLWFIWLIMTVDNFIFSSGKPWTTTLGYLIPFAILCAITWWMRLRLAAHLLVLSFLGWELVTLLTIRDAEDLLLPLLTVVHIAILPLFMLCVDRPKWLRGFEGAAMFYALLASMIYALTAYLGADDWNWEPVVAMAAALLIALPAICGVIARRSNSTAEYDIWICMPMLALGCVVISNMGPDWIAAIYLLALTIWCTRMGWRFDLRRLRGLGMTGFVGAMLAIYAKTVGDSLLGTSGFFLGAGLLLLGSAYAAQKISASAQGDPA